MEILLIMVYLLITCLCLTTILTFFGDYVEVSYEGEKEEISINVFGLMSFIPILNIFVFLFLMNTTFRNHGLKK